MDEELVSICIPVYNGAKYIEETLNSLLIQTHKNIEIIISDNNSTDNTVSVVSKIISKDERVKCNVNSENIGYVNNVNKCISYAESDIIAIFHGDDIYNPTIISDQLSLMKKQNCSGVFSALKTFSKDVNKNRDFYLFTKLYDRFKSPYICGDYSFFKSLLLEYGNIFTCPSFMTTKSAYFEVGGFTDKYPSNEDFELWLRYLFNGHTLGLYLNPKFNYRLSESQGSAIYNKRLKLPEMFDVIDDLIVKKLESNELIDKLEKYKKVKSKTLLDIAYKSSIAKDNNMVREFLAKSKEIYKFSRFTPYGLFQRNILVYIKLKSLKHFIVSLIKK